MIRSCECGSRRFRVDAVYAATDHIELDDDGSEDFTVEDTVFGDSEWEGNVVCAECGKTMTYEEWSNQEEPEPETVQEES